MVINMHILKMLVLFFMISSLSVAVFADCNIEQEFNIHPQCQYLKYFSSTSSSLATELETFCSKVNKKRICTACNKVSQNACNLLGCYTYLLDKDKVNNCRITSMRTEFARDYSTYSGMVSNSSYSSTPITQANSTTNDDDVTGDSSEDSDDKADTVGELAKTNEEQNAEQEAKEEFSSIVERITKDTGIQDKKIESILGSLLQEFPNLKVSRVEASKIKGLYWVVAEDYNILTSEDGRYIISGTIHELKPVISKPDEDNADGTNSD